MLHHEFKIIIKPVDEEHVHEKLKARYLNPHHCKAKVDFQDVLTEIIKTLETAVEDHDMRDKNPKRCSRCRNNKKVIKNFSTLLNMEVKGVVFQSDKYNERYLLTLLTNSKYSLINGFPA